MRHVEVERLFHHPVDRVFRRYTDHVGWSDWAGLGRVRLTREGSPDRDGVGAVRAFSTAPTLREEVTVFEPPVPGSSAPARMEYRVLPGIVPMDDHHGEAIFTPEGSSTRLTWRVTFRPRIRGLGWIIERGLGLLFPRMLASLERDLDARAGSR
jgi:uncharacterized protein YndB with AHSA1/START domain